MRERARLVRQGLADGDEDENWVLTCGGGGRMINISIRKHRQQSGLSEAVLSKK